MVRGLPHNVPVLGYALSPPEHNIGKSKWDTIIDTATKVENTFGNYSETSRQIMVNLCEKASIID
jgi:hypothetical protein